MSEVATGQSVRITFEGRRCIHSRSCVLGLPEVFKANVEGPWIDPDAAPAAEVQALAMRCPSGAIVAERLDGAPDEAPSGRNVVATWENGPYAIRGDLRIGGATRALRATLCRCGDSRNKPYCDGTHVTAGFRASGEGTTPETLPAWGTPGPLTVTPLPDGPLEIEGSHEITSGTGHPLRRGERAFLCRCGGSATKPSCDGSHRRNGFTAGG